MVPFLLGKQICFLSLWLCIFLITLCGGKGGGGGGVHKNGHEMAQGLEAAEMGCSDAKSHFLDKSPPTWKHRGHQGAYS